MIMPLYPVYYCPTAPNAIIGLSPIKEYLQYRVVRLEALSWIKFVDKDGKTWRSNTDKHKVRETLLDFFPIKIIRPRTNVQSSPTCTPIIKAMMCKTQLDWIKIHRRLGHPSDSKLAAMCRSKKIPGLPTIFPTKYQRFKELCPICAKGKMKVTSSGGTIDTSKYLPGQMLHIDFTFYDIISIRGFTCVLIIVDARTRKVWTFCTTSKRPPINIMRFFLHQMQLDDKKPQFIRCDEGGEVIRSEDFCKMLLDEFKITAQTTGGYSSWINGKAERHNQSINTMTRAALIDSGLNRNLWCFALESMADTYNARIHTATGEQPDYEYHGIRRNIHHLRVWGCAIEKKEGQKPKQSEDRSISGYFLGLTHTKCVIKYFDPSQPRSVKHATSAYFFENRTYLPNTNTLSPGSKLANDESCTDIPELNFNTSDHPYLDSVPETITINIQNRPNNLGLFLRDCEHHGMPYIETITSDSPIRRQFPSKYQNNTWIISIGNHEPTHATTAIELNRMDIVSATGA